MIHVIGVYLNSRHRPRRVDATYTGALERPRARAWSIERGDGAVRSAHEAVKHVARVKVLSHSRACRVQAIDRCGSSALERACACARSIESGDGAVRGAHEAVNHVARVKVVSRNRACRIDVLAKGALARTRARAWSIESREGAVGSAQVAVVHIAGVTALSRDCPRRIDAESDGGYLARRVERGKGAVRTPQEAVTDVARVKVVSRNGASRVDGNRIGGALGRARNVERDEGRVPLRSVRGKVQPQHGQG